MPFHTNRKYVVEVKHMPLAPDNIIYWQVFGNGEQIKNLLKLEDEFECTHIYLDNDVKINKSEVVLKEANDDLESSEVLQLKDNLLPKGLAPLEDLFDFNDVAKKPKIEPAGVGVEESNIGTIKSPKIVKLSKSLPPNEKQKYIELLKYFYDVFFWSYEDLKSYDTSIIQHTIPLK